MAKLDLYAIYLVTAANLPHTLNGWNNYLVYLGFDQWSAIFVKTDLWICQVSKHFESCYRDPLPYCTESCYRICFYWLWCVLNNCLVYTRVLISDLLYFFKPDPWISQVSKHFESPLPYCIGSCYRDLFFIDYGVFSCIYGFIDFVV